MGDGPTSEPKGIGRSRGWDPSAATVLAWVASAIGPGAQVVTSSAMETSSTEKQVYEVARPGGRVERLVLRRYHDADRLASDPWYNPANEATALRLLEPSTVPAPRLLAEDLAGVVCRAPSFLETWVPGEPAWEPDDLDGYLTSAAERLVAIHDLGTGDASTLRAYRPYFLEEPGLADPVPRWSAHRATWERVFSLFQTAWPTVSVRFIHRDYHPGNALWDGSAVNGVVDWATAERGPAGVDLARMRQNLAGWHGTEVADRFTIRYVEAGGDPAARSPFWDLLDAADSVAYMDDPGAPGEGDVQRFEDYVEAVVAEL